jgi:hypothetical protein
LSLQKMETQNATSWHNMQADMVREMNLMGDNWETHISTPAKRELGSMNAQNLDTLQAMRRDWQRETEAIPVQMKAGFFNAIGGDLKTWKSTAWDTFTGDLQSSFDRNVGIMVQDFTDGTLDMETVGNLASDTISSALGSYANKMFSKVFETLIDLIAVNIGLGSAASGSTAAQGGGVWAAVGEMATYLAQAGVAMAGSRLAARSFASGGWVTENPTGGWIRQGSGTKDDVFLGSVGNVNHWGMGGEFVVNRESSKAFAPLLEAINRGYADGGSMSVGDQLKRIPGTWRETALMLQGGLASSFGHGMLKGGPYVGLAEMGSFAGMGIGGSFLAKAGKSIGGNNLGFADGGLIPGGAHVGHFSIGGWDPIGDISDAWESAKESISDSWEKIKDAGGDVWENLKSGKLDQVVLDSIDLVHETLVAATPGFMRPLLPDNPVDIIRRLVDPEFLLEMLIESLTGPLETVSKDLRKPGKLWSNPLAGITDMIKSSTKILDATTGVDVEGFLDNLGIASWERGTNYVPSDQLAYIHQGEAVVPANENARGGGASVINVFVQGSVLADDLASIVAREFDNSQARKLGVKYSSIQPQTAGLAL